MICCICYFVAGIVLLLCLHFLERLLRTPRYSLRGKHVLVTGASSGIGLSLCQLASLEGAKVTMVARNAKVLAEAREEVINYPKRGPESSSDVVCLSLDVVDDYKVVLETVTRHVEKEVDVLINCAGICNPARFLDTEMDNFTRTMAVNYTGAVQITKAILPGMLSKTRANPNTTCRVAFVSSIAGTMGLIGYSAYSPSKFAIKGLAEVLRMEMKPFGIGVTVCYPPDTRTKGFEIEKNERPEELTTIASLGGIVEPEAMASTLLADIKASRFHSSIGLDAKLQIACLGGAVAPETVTEAIGQVLILGVIRVFIMASSIYMDYVVATVAKRKKMQKAKES